MSLHSVLWTGGWDSTFRVLDLVINKKEKVRPYYLIDKERAASPVEIKTMEKIRLQVLQEYPETAGCLLPLEIFSRDEIPENPKITSAYNALIERQHVGSQYEWLARFCEHKGISNIELSVDKDIKQRAVLTGARAALASVVIPIADEAETTYKVSPDACDSEQYKVFRYFTFPLFHTTKIEMQTVAKESGFLHILEGSWFCHFPINFKACGRCPPCRATVEKGMGYRLPFMSRYVRYPLRKAEKRLVQLLPEKVIGKLKSLKSKMSY